MVETFAAQFFLLLGIDMFLGGSIVTVLLDSHFPVGLPYIMEIGGFVGFAQLLVGPAYLAGIPPTIQFYYCLGYAAIAFLCIFCSNVYLFFRSRSNGGAGPQGPTSNPVLLGGLFGMAATLPALSSLLFFTSAYVNGLELALPSFPVLPFVWVCVLFVIAVALLVAMIVGSAYVRRTGI